MTKKKKRRKEATPKAVDNPAEKPQAERNSLPIASPNSPAGLLLFFSALATYMLTCSPALGWLDAPEFIAQARTLGNAHSPGFPLPAMVGHLVGLLPVGDWVFRVNLSNSLCGATAVWLLYRCILELATTLRVRSSSGDSTTEMLSALIAACAALSGALWGNSVRAEVYALQALLGLGALWFLLRYAKALRPRDLLSASLFLALGLANHNFMAVTLFVPCAVFVMWSKDRPSLRLSLQTAGIGVLGLLSLLYLPLRSLTHPYVNFGAPHSIERFIWGVRGAAFTKSVTNEHSSGLAVDSVQVIVALVESASIPIFLLCIWGTVIALKSQSLRRIAFLQIGIIAVTCLGRAFLGFDPETPDHHAYLLPAVFSIFLLASVAIFELCQRASEIPNMGSAPRIVAAILVALVAVSFFNQRDQRDLSSAWASDDVAHWEIEKLPPRSLVLLSYFKTTFRMWTLQTVEGARPDIATLDRSFLTYPGEAEEAVRRHPELAKLIHAPLQAGAPSPVPLLDKISKTRPLYAQLHINVDPALGRSVQSAGRFAKWIGFDAPHREELAKFDAAERARLHSIWNEAGPEDEFEARASILWHDFMRLMHLCAKRKQAEAARVYADMIEMAPEDLELQAVGQQCGLRR